MHQYIKHTIWDGFVYDQGVESFISVNQFQYPWTS